MSTYFLVFIAHDPEAFPPTKPLSVDNLQGRLSCCSQRTEELITPWRFVPQHMPVLGFGEGGKKKKKERKDRWKRSRRRVLSLPWGLLSFQIVLVTLLAPTRFIPRLFAASLVYCPVMTSSMATIRLLIARCSPSQWMNGSGMERRICPVVVSKYLKALSFLAACVPVKDKINSSYHGADCRILYLM